MSPAARVGDAVPYAPARMRGIADTRVVDDVKRLAVEPNDCTTRLVHLSTCLPASEAARRREPVGSDRGRCDSSCGAVLAGCPPCAARRRSLSGDRWHIKCASRLYVLRDRTDVDGFEQIADRGPLSPSRRMGSTSR